MGLLRAAWYCSPGAVIVRRFEKREYEVTMARPTYGGGEEYKWVYVFARRASRARYEAILKTTGIWRVASVRPV